jgi:hypothetical protein
VPVFVILGGFICISCFWLNGFTLYANTIETYGIVANAECGQLYHQGTAPCFRGELDFVMASYVVLAWLGMAVFSIMGGVGLIVLPFDLVSEFIYRPKPILPDEFKKRTRILLPRILKLRD